MTAREMLDAAGAGAMIALVIRWLFGIDVERHWAAAIGAVSLLGQPWIKEHLGLLVTAQTLPEVLTGSVVALALLGVAQLISDH